MHAGDHYGLREYLRWSRHDSYWLAAIAALPTLLYLLLGWRWLAVPWVPIALVGTAAAFVSGFKNNASYNRAWEARQIYGAIVNTSRTWGVLTRDFVHESDALSASEAAAVRTRLVHRHVAWLTALRYQLRQPRAWEVMSRPNNVEYRARYYTVAELTGDLQAELAALLSPEDVERLRGVSNRATQLLALQSAQLADLATRGALEPNRHVALARVVADLYDQQGRCERIKNFPYPRQFATHNLFFIRLFVWLMPLGVLGEFAKLGDGWVWLAVPFSFLVGWVFNAMEKLGEMTENPFEGGPNDVPITALSRTIEIDLREMLGEAAVPPALVAVNKILM
jgi:putative membrane protein